MLLNLVVEAHDCVRVKTGSEAKVRFLHFVFVFFLFFRDFWPPNIASNSPIFFFWVPD